MTTLINTGDLEPFASDLVGARGEAMIADVLAKVVTHAPCLATSVDAVILAQAKSILRAAILRRHDALGGARRTESATAGSYSQSVTIDTRPIGGRSAEVLTDSEIASLAALCGVAVQSGSVSPVGSFPAAGVWPC